MALLGNKLVYEYLRYGINIVVSVATITTNGRTISII